MRNWLLALLAAGALTSVAVPVSEPTDPETRADRLFAAFKNQEALPLYQQAWQQHPQDAALLTKLTWCANNVGEDLASQQSEAYYAQAVRYAEQLRQLAPDQAKTWFLLAITKGNLGLFRGGKQKVELARNVRADALKAIELDPDYSPAYCALGIYYREVATLNPVLRFFARNLLGGLPAGTLADAETSLRTATEKEPGNLYAHYQLGLTYETMKQPDKALPCYRTVLALPVVDHQDPLFKSQAAARIQALEKPGR